MLEILKTYDKQGQLQAVVSYDGPLTNDGKTTSTGRFVICDASGMPIPIGKSLNFSRVLLYTRHRLGGGDLLNSPVPWLLLDVIPGKPTPPDVTVAANEKSLKMTFLARCLLKSRLKTPPSNDRLDHAPCVEFQFTLDFKFVDGDSIAKADLFSKGKNVTSESGVKLKDFVTAFKNTKIDIGLSDLNTAPRKHEFPLFAEVLKLDQLGQTNSLKLMSFRFEAESYPGSSQEAPAMLRPRFERTMRVLNGTSDEIVIPNPQNNGASELGFPLPKLQTLDIVQIQSASAYDVAYMVPETPLPGTFNITLSNVPPEALLEKWNKEVATPHYDSLDTVEGGRNASIVPYFTTTTISTTLTRQLNFVVWDRSAEQNFFPSSTIKALTGSVPDGGIGFTTQNITLEGSAPVKFILKRLRDHDGKGLEFSGSLEGPDDPANFDFLNGAPPQFHFQVANLEPLGGVRILRIGALDVDFGLEAPPIQSTALKAQASVSLNRPSVEMAMSTPWVRARPGGQDDVPGEEYESLGETIPVSERSTEAGFRRERPLLVEYPQALMRALGGTQKVPTERWQTIDAVEQTRLDRSQSLTMRLLQPQRDRSGGMTLNRLGISATTNAEPTVVTERSVLVLDRSPFLIARVDVPPLLPSPDGQEIGNWSNAGLEGTSWELIGSALGFRLWLPPQGVGEATEKGKEEDGLHDLETGQQADFRFSPPTQFMLHSSYFRQRFMEAPWNLRRILGYAGQRAAGAGVGSIRWEMLYGLTGRVKPEHLRLAYLEARTGRPPGRLDKGLRWEKAFSSISQKNAYQAFRERWADQFRRHATQLGVLEPWLEGEALDKDGNPLPLELTDNVEYTLRSSAKLRYPISTDSVPLEGKRRFDAPHTPDGLAGGVSYGFESANIYDSLWKSPGVAPVSTEGLLSAPAFSATGGFGYQKASFDRGRIKIHAHIWMGRVWKYEVETIGRISMLWNPAKHVVVYERSVVSPLAFTKQQDNFEGRPVLRKMREYVEVSVPERSYPEKGANFPVSDPAQPGFVSFSSFQTKTIEVDSRWGGDVGSIGWQVPLWQPQSPYFTGKEDVERDRAREKAPPTGLDPYAEAPSTIGDYMQLFHMLRKPVSFGTGLDDFRTYLNGLLDAKVQIPEPVGTPGPLTNLLNQLATGMIRPLDPTTAQGLSYPTLKSFMVEVLNERLDDFKGETFTPARIAELVQAGLEISDEARQRQLTLTDKSSRVEWNRIMLEDTFGLLLRADKKPPADVGPPTAIPVSTLRLYPKPDIKLGLQTKAGPVEKSCIEDVFKLRFFTLTGVKQGNDFVPNTESDTDKWAAIVDIDFPYLPLPTAPEVPFGDGGDLDRKLAPATSVEAGYAPFTLHLAPQTRQINLTAGRTASEVGSFVQSVTLLRSQPAPPTTLANANEAIVAAAKLSDSVHASLGELLIRMPKSGSLSSGMRVEVLEAISRARTKLGDHVNVVDAFLQGGHLRNVDSVCDQVRSTVDATMTRGKKRVGTELDKFISDLDAQIVMVMAQTNDVNKAAKAVVAAEIDLAKMLIRPITTGTEDLVEIVQAARAEMQRGNRFCRAALDELRFGAKQLVVLIEDLAQRGEADITVAMAQVLLACRRLRLQIQAVAAALKDFVQEWLAALTRLLRGRLGQLLGTIKDDLEDLVDTGLKKITQLTSKLDTLIALIERGITEAATIWKIEWRDAVTDFEKALKEVVDEFESKLAHIQEKFQNGTKILDTALSKVLSPLQNALREVNFVASQLDLLHQNINAAIDDASDPRTLQKKVSDNCQTIRQAIMAALDKVSAEVLPNTDFCTHLKRLLTDEATYFAKAEVNKRLQAAIKSIEDIVNTNDVELDAIRRAIEEGARRLENEAEAYGQRTRDTVRRVIGDAEPFYQQAAHGLSLARALADAPEAIGLTFNRDRIAYYFKDPSRLSHTPVVALANRVGNDLKALGIRLPTRELADRFLPSGFDQFDVSKLFPDFAGLKLSNLIPGLSMPAGASDKVRVTHGLDPQTRRAWLNAVVDFTFAEDATIFTFGPVTLRLRRAQFYAEARISVGENGTPQQTANGYILGDWEVQIGERALVTFAKSKLLFDNSGSLKFDIAADRVQLSSPLNFLTQLMSSIGGGDSGPLLNIVKENGIPCGFESMLAVSLPNLQFGAFGVSNLGLRTSFRLTLRPGPDGLDFAISIGLALSSREHPFVIVIFILGGGGWVESNTTYHPVTGAITTATSIGLTATARLEFSLGPLSGGVGVDVSLSAEFFAATGAGGTMHVCFTICVWGEIQALGFISVSLRLTLQAEYQSGGALIGRGSVSIKIKICFCFTFEFSASVEYKLAGGSGSQGTRSLKTRLADRHAIAVSALPTGKRTFDVRGIEQPTPLSVGRRAAEPHLYLTAAGALDPYEESAKSYLEMFEELAV